MYLNTHNVLYLGQHPAGLNLAASDVTGSVYANQAATANENAQTVNMAPPSE